MALVQTTPPSVEPVSVDEVRLHCRIDNTAEDTLLSMLIGAARLFAESYTSRSFITQSWRQVLDAFPGNGGMGVPAGVGFSLPGNAILLDRGPVQAITSITYTAMDGSTQTMPSSAYVADLSGAPARITPRFGQIWPVTLPQIGSVQVNYTAGYGDSGTAVPEGVRNWILLRVASLYRTREEAAIVQGKVEKMPWVDCLLDPYTVWRM